MFANHGHRVEPYLIDKITDGEGNVLFTAGTGGTSDGGAEPPQVISARNAFVMDNLLQSVVDAGTGNGVRRYLQRGGVTGKAGTTNDAVDGWFAGYATVTWMGFDDNHSLGRHEFGATTALPIWAAYGRAGWPACPSSVSPPTSPSSTATGPMPRTRTARTALRRWASRPRRRWRTMPTPRHSGGHARPGDPAAALASPAAPTRRHPFLPAR